MALGRLHTITALLVVLALSSTALGQIVVDAPLNEEIHTSSVRDLLLQPCLIAFKF